jgi:hypothetical protein
MMMAKREIEEDSTKRIHPGRPFVLSVLFWGFTFWALLGWFRFARALVERSLILEVLSPSYYAYLLLTGLINGLGALPVLWGLLRAAPWTMTLIWVMAVYYPALYWFESLVLWVDPDAGGNWPFMLLLTLLWFILVIWASGSKRSRRYFKGDEKGIH